MKSISDLIKKSAYVLFLVTIIKDFYSVAVETSYLSTGKIMGVQSIIMLLWSCFVSFLISLVVYGAGMIVQYYEVKKEELINESKKQAGGGVNRRLLFS